MRISFAFLLLICFNLPAQPNPETSPNGKYGYKENDIWVVEPQYQWASTFNYNSAWVKQANKWMLIDRTGRQVIPSRYDDVKIDASEDSIVRVKLAGKYGLVNMSSGKEIVPTIYSKINNFEDLLYASEYFARVIRNGKVGIVDRSGKEVVACLFDNTRSQLSMDKLIGDSLFLVTMNGHLGVVKFYGGLIVPCKFDGINVEDESLWYKVRIGKKHGLYSWQGKEVIPCEYEQPVIVDISGFAMVVKNKKCGLMNMEGKLVVPCTYDHCDSVPIPKQ